MQKGAELLKKVHINWWAKRKITALSTAEQVNISSPSVVNPHYTAVCRHLYLLNIKFYILELILCHPKEGG